MMETKKTLFILAFATMSIGAIAQGNISNEDRMKLAAGSPVTVKTVVGPLVLQPPFKTVSNFPTSLITITVEVFGL